MGAKNTMNMFFAAMNEQVAPTRGYGPKIISTPMGPFTWNDNLNVWVNSNNGMQMNNIAFQDMYAMMDYGTATGDSGSPAAVSISPITPADGWGSLVYTASADASTVYYASTSGAQTLAANGTLVTFTGISSTINVTLTTANVTGTSLAELRYSKNGGAFAPYVSAISIALNDTLKIAMVTPGIIPASGGGNVIVTNTTNSVVLDTIPYSYSMPDI
jgi:hypothetical protein